MANRTNCEAHQYINLFVNPLLPLRLMSKHPPWPYSPNELYAKSLHT